MPRSISLLSKAVLHTWGIIVVALGLIAIYYLTVAEPLDPQLSASPVLTRSDRWTTAPGAGPSAELAAQGKTGSVGKTSTRPEDSPQWSERIQDRLQSIEVAAKLAEIRSYQNKLMVRELVRLLRAAVVVLVIIAVGFPFIVWLLSTKRIVGLSRLSQEVAATLVVVEERQSKLAAILRDIQIEMDYLQSKSSPDLTAMMEQARSYLEQNEKDLVEIRESNGAAKQDTSGT